MSKAFKRLTTSMRKATSRRSSKDREGAGSSKESTPRKPFLARPGRGAESGSVRGGDAAILSESAIYPAAASHQIPILSPAPPKLPTPVLPTLDLLPPLQGLDSDLGDFDLYASPTRENAPQSPLAENTQFPERTIAPAADHPMAFEHHVPAEQVRPREPSSGFDSGLPTITSVPVREGCALVMTADDDTEMEDNSGEVAMPHTPPHRNPPYADPVSFCTPQSRHSGGLVQGRSAQLDEETLRGSMDSVRPRPDLGSVASHSTDNLVAQYPPSSDSPFHPRLSRLFELEMISLEQYCFDIAFITDWMNGDVSAPLGTILRPSAALEEPKKRKKTFRMYFPSPKKIKGKTPASDIGPSSVEVGPLAQYATEVLYWEPPEAFFPIDVQLFFLHLKAFIESLTTLLSPELRRDDKSVRVLPPRFLHMDSFNDPENFKRRISHIIKALRMELRLLQESYPSTLIPLDAVTHKANCIGRTPSGSRESMRRSSHSNLRGSMASFRDLSWVQPDLIRILVPDDPVVLLQELLRRLPKQMMADDHLPLDKKSKLLFDRTCLMWRVGPVMKEILLVQWVFDALVQQDVVTLWGCLAIRLDKLELTTRREINAVSTEEISRIRGLITLLVQHSELYVSSASDDTVQDLTYVLAVVKHVYALSDLFHFSLESQVAESFSLGYTRRVLCLEQQLSGDLNDESSNAGCMSRINQGAQQVQHLCATLGLPEAQRLHISFFMARAFLDAASKLCPLPLSRRDICEQLGIVCHQYRRMRELEDIMQMAKRRLSDHSGVSGAPCSGRSTQEGALATPPGSSNSFSLLAIRDRAHVDFVWDPWLMQLEELLFEELEQKIEDDLTPAHGIKGGNLKHTDNTYMESTTSALVIAGVTERLKRLDKYIDLVLSIPFPDCHHVIRVVKALTRILTRCITHAMYHTYQKVLSVAGDRAAFQRGQLAAGVEELRAIRYDLAPIQAGVERILSTLNLRGYRSPLPKEEVMIAISVDKTEGLAMEVRADGEPCALIPAETREGTFYVSATGRRQLAIKTERDDEQGGSICSSSNVMLTLHLADENQDLKLPAAMAGQLKLTPARADECYVQVYFQGCLDRLAETVDSLLSVAADKMAQQIVNLSKEFKRASKRINTEPKDAAASGLTLEGQISNLLGTFRTLARTATPHAHDTVSSLRENKLADVEVYLNAILRTFRDLQRIENEALQHCQDHFVTRPQASATLFRDSVWQAFSSRMTQHLLRDKTGQMMKVRPDDYVKFIEDVVLRVRDTLFEDEGTPLPKENVYLLVLIDQYWKETFELQQDYLANIMGYLDAKGQIRSPARVNSRRRQPTDGDPSRPPRPKVENPKDKLLARITSNRQSMFFDTNLFQVSDDGKASRKTLPRQGSSLSPKRRGATQQGPRSTAMAQPAEGDRCTRPMSQLLLSSWNASKMSLVSSISTGEPDEPPELTDTKYYPLLAVLAVLQVRAQRDADIRAWLDDQKQIEIVIMNRLQGIPVATPPHSPNPPSPLPLSPDVPVQPPLLQPHGRLAVSRISLAPPAQTHGNR